MVDRSGTGLVWCGVAPLLSAGQAAVSSAFISTTCHARSHLVVLLVALLIPLLIVGLLLLVMMVAMRCGGDGSGGGA